MIKKNESKKECNNFFKNTNVDDRREKLIEFIAETISFQIKTNKEI
ncbi:MAG: hypothetical protein FWF46_00720 [Oscillospiraceae bacterium]|nr:hypothetical protein [Oscillospiraceae bacterium]